MKCKDCQDVMCKHRTVDAEQECVLERTFVISDYDSEFVVNRGLRFADGRLYTVEEHSKPNRSPYEVSVDVTDKVLDMLLKAYDKKVSEAKQAAIIRQLKL